MSPTLYLSLSLSLSLSFIVDLIYDIFILTPVHPLNTFYGFCEFLKFYLGPSLSYWILPFK